MSMRAVPKQQKPQNTIHFRNCPEHARPPPEHFRYDFRCFSPANRINCTFELGIRYFFGGGNWRTRAWAVSFCFVRTSLWLQSYVNISFVVRITNLYYCFLDSDVYSYELAYALVRHKSVCKSHFCSLLSLPSFISLRQCSTCFGCLLADVRIHFNIHFSFSH